MFVPLAVVLNPNQAVRKDIKALPMTMPAPAARWNLSGFSRRSRRSASKVQWM